MHVVTEWEKNAVKLCWVTRPSQVFGRRDALLDLAVCFVSVIGMVHLWRMFQDGGFKLFVRT